MHHKKQRLILMKSCIQLLLFILMSGIAEGVFSAELSTGSAEQIKANRDEHDHYLELDVGVVMDFGRSYIQGIDEHQHGELNSSLMLSGTNLNIRRMASGERQNAFHIPHEHS